MSGVGATCPSLLFMCLERRGGVVVALAWPVAAALGILLSRPSTRVAADLETGWHLEIISRRDTCSNELRSAKPKVLMASPPCPLFLKLQNFNIGKSIQLKSTESAVITARSHLIFPVRECFQKMHRGDHFILQHPSNASSWSEQCIQELMA